MTSDIQTKIRQHGFVRIRSESPDTNLAFEEIEDSMSSFAAPLHVFQRHPFWKPIRVDPARPAGRSEGTGFNSLHIDCISSESPPDFVAMHCVRPDPNGGGATILSDWTAAVSLLSRQALGKLRDIRIPAEPTYDLEGVGRGLSIYPLLSDRFPRYSGRYLDDYDFSREEQHALLELERVLLSISVVMPLRAGDTVIIDQRRVLHGRLPLAVDSHGVISTARLLVQAFFKELG